MIKTDLPVILLKGILLLPNNDIRLEFSNDDSKNIIDVSELFHDGEILVVSTTDLPEKPNIDKLPNRSSTIFTKFSDAKFSKYCSSVKYSELHTKKPNASIAIYFKLFFVNISPPHSKKIIT